MASRQTSSKRNPAWTRDELILALELYLKNPAHPPLSAELNKIGQTLSAQKNKKFRNANGVYMKMMISGDSIRIIQHQGRLDFGGLKDEKSVWLEFAGNKKRLVVVADAIRKAAVLLPAAKRESRRATQMPRPMKAGC